jgi:catechol 2,3-dioxygenase-like lactoylglutathione lyase family enzyme
MRGPVPHSRGILHVNLNVSSLARSIRFYTDALGFSLVLESEEIADLGSGPETIHQAILTVPKTMTIFALTEAPSLEVGGKGLNHIGLVLESDEDVSRLVQQVEALGGSAEKRGIREQGGVREEFAYVRDPDGYAIELSTQAILYARFEE